MPDLKRIEGIFPSLEKSSPKMEKASFFGRTVEWFSSKDDSTLVKVAKIALAIFLAAILTASVIGIVPLALAIKEWKKGPIALDRTPPVADPLPKKDVKPVVKPEPKKDVKLVVKPEPKKDVKLVVKSEPTKNVKPVVKSFSKAQVVDIEIFVEKFLHAYITGQITRQTEDKNRQPMMDLLLEHLGQVDENERKEIEEAALQAYFEKAAMGFYVHLAIADLEDLKVEDPKLKGLKDALSEAIPKDFPGLMLTSRELEVRVAQAIEKVNQQRCIAVVESKKGLVEGRPLQKIETVGKVLELLGAYCEFQKQNPEEASGAPSLFL